MNEPVLDASAVLAVLNGEAGHETVASVLPAALISTVNLTEVISRLCERGMPADATMEGSHASALTSWRIRRNWPAARASFGR